MEAVTEIDGQLLRLRGRLDVSGTEIARDSLDAALRSGSGALVVDLADVELLDAAGLGVLVGAHRRADRAGRRLVLRAVPPRLSRILLLTRLDRVLAIEPAVVAAA